MMNMHINQGARQTGQVLGRLAVALLLAVVIPGLSCIRQQDEVLARPEDPQTTQSTEQSK